MRNRFDALRNRASVLAVLFGALLSLSAARADAQSVYRCFSTNVRSSGSSCTWPAITFNPDGTYQESSTHGQYKISGDEVILARSIRGRGRIHGTFITFKYTYGGNVQTVTYYNNTNPLHPGMSPAVRAPDRGGAAADRSRAGATISVNLTMHFRCSDGALSPGLLVFLTPEGQPPSGRDRIKTEGLVDHQACLVRAQFERPPVPTGAAYDVWIDNFSEKRRIGKVDLRGATKDPTDVSFDAHTMERR